MEKVKVRVTNVLEFEIDKLDKVTADGFLVNVKGRAIDDAEFGDMRVEILEMIEEEEEVAWCQKEMMIQFIR